MNIEIQRKKRQNYEKHDGKGTALRMVNSYPRSLCQSGLWEKRGKQQGWVGQSRVKLTHG